MSCRRDKVTDKRYLYPIRHSRLSLNYRKKLAQLVRESDLVFRAKRQIKTLLTNVVAEHVESRMSNAKQGNGESVVHNKAEYTDVQCHDVLLILYTGPYHIYKTILARVVQKTDNAIHRINLYPADNC